MRARSLAVFGVLGAIAFAGARSVAAQDSALDQKVRAFLESHRDEWRDLNVPWQDGQLLHDLVLKHRYTRALVLLGPSPLIEEVLVTAGVPNVVPVVADLAAARAALGN